MKLFIPTLFLLAATACCIEVPLPQGMQAINYQNLMFQPPMYQFTKPAPDFIGVPPIPPHSPHEQAPDFIGRPPIPPHSPHSAECQNYNRPRKGQFILSFDWAPRTKGVNIRYIDTSQGLVKMESQILATLTVQNGNTGVKHEDISLTLENGDHTLIFEGIGKSDGFGISIANVVLRRRDQSKNLLINGNFSYPNVGLNRMRYIRGGIQGWAAEIAEIGDCKYYNNDWKSGQCIELDTTKNQFYSQKIRVGSC